MTKPSWKLSEAQKAEIAKLYGEGVKVESIAFDFKIANGAVIHIARSAGHAPRRAPRPRVACDA